MFKKLLQQQNLTVVITGDSLSFNRYGYNTHTWGDAHECGAGMPSWSFKLRDQLYKSDPQFISASQIKFNCPTFSHLIPTTTHEPYTALFNDDVQSALPIKKMEFTLPLQGDQIVLYLQQRLDSPCKFDIAVDGKVVLTGVDTGGNPHHHVGYAPMLLRLPCDPHLAKHKITFINISGSSPVITIAGAGVAYKNVVLTGRGSMCTDFFIENFEERIGRYKPDLLLLTLGANDRGHHSKHQFAAHLKQLLTLIFNRVPHCRLLFLLPTSAHDPKDPESDALPYCSLAKAEEYNALTEQICHDFTAQTDAKIETMRISSLFDDHDVDVWRFDNVHLNPYGNDILHNAVAERLGLK